MIRAVVFDLDGLMFDTVVTRLDDPELLLLIADKGRERVPDEP
jgi:hypothetical protein